MLVLLVTDVAQSVFGNLVFGLQVVYDGAVERLFVLSLGLSLSSMAKNQMLVTSCVTSVSKPTI